MCYICRKMKTKQTPNENYLTEYQYLNNYFILCVLYLYVIDYQNTILYIPYDYQILIRLAFSII